MGILTKLKKSSDKNKKLFHLPNHYELFKITLNSIELLHFHVAHRLFRISSLIKTRQSCHRNSWLFVHLARRPLTHFRMHVIVFKVDSDHNPVVPSKTWWIKVVFREPFVPVITVLCSSWIRPKFSQRWKRQEPQRDGFPRQKCVTQIKSMFTWPKSKWIRHISYF